MQKFEERQYKRFTKKRRKGFTLIEIMVVVVIMGILATVSTGVVIARLEEARRTTAKVQIEGFVTELDMYRLHNGVYPTTQQGLDALVKKPTIAPIPRRYPSEPYMRNIPNDPWGNSYIYRCPGERGAFDIVAVGPDGEEGGEGRNADINNHDAL
ncbi:MAG: type II secretion system major pseudopilin GspG [Synergistaceae bacterium]|jgi:general secretion pathway protein G|nr:type II secretion system major pseudopilin GspG [Synergistaceae bacterium]